MISDKGNVKQIKGYNSGEFASIGLASDVDCSDPLEMKLASNILSIG